MKPLITNANFIILNILIYLLIGCSALSPRTNDYSKISKEEKHNILHKMNVHDIKSKYIMNSKVGKLFVIRGNVKNEIDTVMENISVKAVLHITYGDIVDEKIVICGNSISDNELEYLDIDIINERMTKFEKNNTLYKVNPGERIDFIVVFSNFPPEIGEFTIGLFDASLL